MTLPDIRQPGPATAEELERARAFIAARRWTFAKTMPLNPHEYTVRTRHPAADDEFEYFVAMVRELGFAEQYGDGARKATYIYYVIDGWKYWTMGAPIAVTTIINREDLRP